jgi:hypothetical protein
MIVFEEQLARLVDVLPPFTDANATTFNIKYSWGDINELNKYMFVNSNQVYPLIWLTAGEDTHNLGEPNVKRNATIVIATKSLMQDELNPFQYENDFKVILQPILDNLIKALQRSGISIFNETTVKTNRVANYGVDFRIANEIKTLDVWNAIVFDAEITFTSTSTCLNNFNFK